MITVPISILFILWLLHTHDLYKSDRFHFGIVNQEDMLLSSGNLNFVYLLDALKQAVVGSKGKADFNIYIDNNALAELNYDLPYSGLGGENYKPAHMLYPDGNLEKIQLRYRGDLANHWLFKEKSYRIKTRKKKLLGKMRQFNLIVNETGDLLGPQMAYKLAEIMGLLTPKSDFVTMNVNGRPEGAKLFVEQIDESFLRRRGVMPGDIYSGDNIGNGRFWGLDRTLFKTSMNWEKSAANNHYDLQSKIPLQTMITALQNNNFDLLDMEQFGKFAAYNDLMRSKHSDDAHNWKLLYDNYLERFSPIVWDNLGWFDPWVRDQERGGIAVSTLMKKLYRNHDFLYERQKALIDFYSYQQDTFLASLKTEARIVEDKTRGIDYLVDAFGEVRDRNDMLKAVSKYKDTVQRVLQEVKKFTVGMNGSYVYAPIDNGVRLAISDVPVSSFRIDINPGAGPVSIGVRYKADGTVIERNLSALSERVGNSIVVRQRLIPASLMNRENHSFSGATFDILVDGVDASSIVSLWVTPMTVNAQEIAVDRVDHVAQSEFENEFRIIPEIPDSIPIVFSGTKVIEEFVIIKRDLVIEPGTRLLFSAGAGLKVFGKISAIGTPEAPITFSAANPEIPWGAVVVKDHASDGSRFEHCLFEDGSGIKSDVYEYTAMLSVHNASQILIKNSVFRNSHITDDMLHVVYGDIRIENSLFENSLADAVDLDITNAEIIGSRFVGSGNDAVDLMSSKVLISDSEMKNSGDKGVSIGENSLLFSVNSRFLDNLVGIQSKDDSTAVISNSLIAGNATGVHAYQKNWQYGTGGKLTIANSIIEGNQQSSSIGENSEITIFDSYVDEVPVTGKLPDLIQTDSRFRERSQSNLPLNIEHSDDFFANYLPLIDGRVRGVFANSK